jgi:hypothetical protein
MNGIATRVAAKPSRASGHLIKPGCGPYFGKLDPWSAAVKLTPCTTHVKVPLVAPGLSRRSFSFINAVRTIRAVDPPAGVVVFPRHIFFVAVTQLESLQIRSGIESPSQILVLPGEFHECALYGHKVLLKVNNLPVQFSPDGQGH